MFNWLWKKEAPTTKTPEPKPPEDKEPEAVRFLKNLFAAHPDYKLEVSPAERSSIGTYRHITVRFPTITINIIHERDNDTWSCAINGTVTDSAGTKKTVGLYSEGIFRYTSPTKSKPIFEFLFSRLRLRELRSTEEEQAAKEQEQKHEAEERLKNSLKAQYLKN